MSNDTSSFAQLFFVKIPSIHFISEINTSINYNQPFLKRLSPKNNFFAPVFEIFVLGYFKKVFYWPLNIKKSPKRKKIVPDDKNHSQSKNEYVMKDFVKNCKSWSFFHTLFFYLHSTCVKCHIGASRRFLYVKTERLKGI